MTEKLIFKGFPRETVHFFKQLKKNNTKEWFDQNKENYDQHVMVPARRFVQTMGQRLQREISSNIVAIPKVNQSIFRIYRDTRFSMDKTPYKTHLGIYFWEGRGKKLENSGFYFHLEPGRLMLGGGIYMFPRNKIPLYRGAVADPQLVLELDEAVQKIQKSGRYSLGGQHYKRIPAGFDVAEEYQHYLLHNGLWASFEDDIPRQFYSEELVDYCLKVYKDLHPLHRWLLMLSADLM
jgi:uncharacterized protein (TIGR02453 family)